MVVLPKLKKKVNAFLVSEEGKITKESILKAGVILGSFAISSALLSKGAIADTSHTNEYGQTRNEGGGFVGEHAHHASHSSGTATGTGTGTGTGTYY